MTALGVGMTQSIDLLARLEAAAGEGLAANLARFLHFLGWQAGEVLELQALRIPANKAAGRWRDTPAMAAHASSLPELVRLCEQAEGWGAQGVYVILNLIKPAVQSRRGPGQWHEVPKGEGTKDGDILRRRVLYLDLDPERADGVRGISATEDELAVAVERAGSLRDLLLRFVPEASLGVGLSGNGCALFVALEPTAPEGESERLIKAVLVAAHLLLSDDRVKVDVSVSDPKRLGPALGTIKRKGVHSPERPHRRSAFLGPQEPSRLGLPELRTLLAGLRSALPSDEARATVDKELAPTSPKGHTSQPNHASPASQQRPVTHKPASTKQSGEVDAFRVANEIPIGEVLAKLDLGDTEQPTCPGCGESDKGVAVVGNGLKCQHNRCSAKGVRLGFRTVVDLVMEREITDEAGALDWLRSHFPEARLPERKTSATKPPRKRRQAAPHETPAATTGFKPTDTGNAERFCAQHGHDVRFCAKWGKWLVWTGQRWAEDDHLRVEHLAKHTVRSIYREAGAIEGFDDTAQAQRKELGSWARKSEARDRRRAMIELARSEEGIPVAPAELDHDPWALCTENGTLDLQTGELRPHRREDLITKLAPVPYDPAATCPLFLAFLDRITASNRELQTFLQRFLGYCLTGVIREHVLVMAWGSGANGKSTLLKTFLALLGDYAYQAPADLILAKKGETHPTDQTGLFGRRFVVCMETPEGRPMDEARMKALTGGDSITARRMHEDFWSFEPTHKLVLGTNHRPTIRTTDHGTWRRQKLVPFTVTIPDHEQDKALAEKLRSEFAGILRWAVEGCLAWQREGLGEPAAVRDATSAWRQESDPLASFLAAECELGEGYEVEVGALYAAFERCARETSDEVLSKQAFGRRLTERGVGAARRETARLRLGVRLRPGRGQGG